MHLPNLHLENGAFLIDNSTLELLQTCLTQYKYASLFKRVTAQNTPALNFGTAQHEVLALRYREAKDKEVSPELFQKQCDYLTQFFSEHPVDEFERRNLNHAIEVTKRYNLRYGVEPFNVLVDEKGRVLCEEPFGIKIHEVKYKGQTVPVYFIGKIDLPVSWDSKIIIVDHKTDSMFFGPQRSSEEQEWSNQFRGYAYAFEKTTGTQVDGFCVNLIPTKEPPAKPKQGIDNWWDEWFMRNKVLFEQEPNWREEWLQSTIGLIDNLFWWLERDELPMVGRFTRACAKYGGCPYLPICACQNETARTDMLNGILYVDQTWSPINKKQTNEKPI